MSKASISGWAAKKAWASAQVAPEGQWVGVMALSLWVRLGGHGDGGRTVVWQVAMALAIGFMKWDCARRDAERNVDHIALGSHRDDFARVGPDMRFAQTFSQGGKAETQETAGRHGDAGIRIDQGQAIVLKD